MGAILLEHEAQFCSKFKNKLRTSRVLAKKKVSNFQVSIKYLLLIYMYEIAASANQLANCILLHAYIYVICAPSLFNELV